MDKVVRVSLLILGEHRYCNQMILVAENMINRILVIHVNEKGGDNMDDIIIKLRNAYKELGNKKHEEMVKQYVIINTFMEYFGYNDKKFIPEEAIVKGFCDIYVPIDGEKALIIEVKNGNRAIEVEDIEQVRTYAGSRGQRFAILTNGYEYVLLDFSIETSSKLEGNVLESFVVFWFDIFKTRAKERTELRYFKYLNLDNLYNNQSTHFYCDVAQYRVWKYEQGMKYVSWNSYRCSLFQLFDLFAPKVLAKKNYEQIGKRFYENFDMEEFDIFINECKRNGKDTSTKTMNNNHTHIYNMLYELEKHEKIRYISLSDSRKKNLNIYKETEDRRGVTELKSEDVQMILDFLKTKRNSNRDIVIFLLEVTLGLERAQLLELNWDAFDKEYKHISIGERKIEICPILQEYLIKLNKEAKKAKIKSPRVFQVRYNGKYRPMREWNINDVFNNFVQIANDEKWKDYSPKFIRKSLIRTLFFAGFSLEDIMFITGIDINNISKYIKMNELLQRRSKKINWKQLYDGVLCKEA